MSDHEPIAVVDGEDVNELPSSLYIPPEAMRVFLERFSGPLDLLLYLVRRDRIDMRDVPVAELTKQYIAYVEQVVSLQLDLAAEYLMMSAILIEIKTRMLLPRKEEEEEEEDPRAELVRRLMEYERIKAAAARMGEIPRRNRDFIVARIALILEAKPKPQIDAQELRLALETAIERKSMPAPELMMERERLSLREAMSLVMHELSEQGRSGFYRLFKANAAVREQVGVMLMAVLELANERVVSIRQKGWEDEIDLRLPGRGRNAR